jgi:myotubularin-related protein 6/7/8
LTPHHLIFVHQPPPVVSEDGEKPIPQRPREIWITYPIIQNCTLRLFPQWSAHQSSIRLRCRDFNFYCFRFLDEKKARDVFDSIKAWTCKIGKVEKLYAFSYQSPKPEKEIDGWSIYDARQEFKRMGISEKGADKGWRISQINADYGVGTIIFGWQQRVY